MPGRDERRRDGRTAFADPPEPSVLYVSGYTDHEKFHSPSGTRGMHFLSKPFQPHELLTRVKSMMAHRPGGPRRASS